ncbi:hypothetical protein ACU4GD_01920 [Cupriavidus basilensis]
MRDISYWSHLTQAMRGMQDGVGVAGGGASNGVANALRAAQRCATDDFQHAFALLKESLAWRRGDDLARSRAALQRFDRIVGTGTVDTALPTFAAMARVVRAWERYAGNQMEAAQAELESLAADPALQPVVRYNPRVRFETLNLGALIHKTVAIRDMATQPEAARQAAEAAVAGFSGALQAAYDADSVDAAQHVAANLGLCLWLFWNHALIDPARRWPAGQVRSASRCAGWACRSGSATASAQAAARRGTSSSCCVSHAATARQDGGGTLIGVPRAAAAAARRSGGRAAPLPCAVCPRQGLYPAGRRWPPSRWTSTMPGTCITAPCNSPTCCLKPAGSTPSSTATPPPRLPPWSALGRPARQAAPGGAPLLPCRHHRAAARTAAGRG